ncbi:MAG TPA: acetoin utilization protein AcuC [Desulfuromonadales bacterium]|nr:acetoin utilization protein AcuC [Desulfuromonadales bacterium]
MKTSCALIYSSRFADYSYGEDHPFKVVRYRLAHDLMAELDLLDCQGVRVVESPLAPEEALLTFHRRDYLETLKEFSLMETPRANFIYGLGDVENPVFQGLYDWSRLVAGGTLEAAWQVVEQGVRVAFNIGGGWHHAHAARASGFSYLNDAVIAINGLVARGLKVAYVDIDAHHGDGVQEAFYDTDRVLTISLHESGRDFFPHTGFTKEMGEGSGYGYSVNVPFTAHADDLIFEQAFQRVVLPLLDSYRPDVLVTQLGVDTLRTDPMTRLELTTGAIEFAARSFLETGLPWIALGGGGYDRLNVARAWSLIWGIIVGASLPDMLPPRFATVAAELGDASGRLRDLPHLAQPDDYARAQLALDKTLRLLEKRVFPLYGLKQGASS